MTTRYNQKDILAMFVLPIAAFISILYFSSNLLISTFLFFGLPSIYLSFRNPKAIPKTFLFTFLLTIPLTLIFDYLLVLDKGWYIVTTVFPYRLFGVITIEQFFFSFQWVYFLVSFYEFFFDRKISLQKDHLVSKPMLFFGLTIFLIAFILIGIFIKNPIIIIHYAYAFFGITVGLIPISLFLWHFPHLLSRFIKITAYFFLLSLLVEYAGLNLNLWIFPGSHYVWTIGFFGFRIPIEEVLCYFILSTPGLLTYYEYLDDDRK